MTEGPVPLATTSICHTYIRADRPVIADVDLEFSSSTLTAIWGPSGSGKSTLLSILGLLMPASSGVVQVFGEDAWQSAYRARALRSSAFAWVLQNSACLEARSALENVMLAILSSGEVRGDAAVKATDALELVSLNHRRNALASELSGGEVQRMTVARAFAQHCPVVLADEPTGQLDAKSSEAVAEAFKALAEAGRVVIVATHDRALADQCDRVLAVEDGRISL